MIALFLGVQAGGGQFPTGPSPPTSRAVARFLHKAGLPVEAVALAEQMGVAATVGGFMKLQGCQLWRHTRELEEVKLTREQEDLIGSGCACPAVDLGGVPLTPEQVVSFLHFEI